MLQSISNIFKAKIIMPSVVVDGDFILSKDQFLTFQTAFKRLAQAKEVTASDMMLYNIVRGKPINNGFTPITNTTKLFNGMYPNMGCSQAKHELRDRLSVRGQALVSKFDNFVSYTTLDGNGSRIEQLRRSNQLLMTIYDTIK